MDSLNAQRLAELMHSRDTHEQPADVAPRISGTNAIWSYWQGRIDEFCAQNAVADDELAALIVRLNRGRPSEVAAA